MDKPLDPRPRPRPGHLHRDFGVSAWMGATRSDSAAGPRDWQARGVVVMHALAVVSAALAAHTASAADLDVTLTDPVVWSNIGVNNNNVRVLTPGVAIGNPAGCADPDSYIVSSGLAAPLQSRLLAVLLAAKASGRAVVIRVDGFEQGRPSITSARF